MVTALCLTLCDPLDCSPLGSSIHRISQARILEWVALPFSRGSSWLRYRICIPALAGRFSTTVPSGKLTLEEGETQRQKYRSMEQNRKSRDKSTWKRLKVGAEGENRGWDGWMASLTQWTWVWVNSRIWWWTGKPSALQSIGSQRVRHTWVTELYLLHQLRKILSFLPWALPLPSTHHIHPQHIKDGSVFSRFFFRSILCR